MRKSIDYLNDALKVIGDVSEAKKAAILGLTPQELNRYTKGLQVLTPWAVPTPPLAVRHTPGMFTTSPG